MRSYNFTWRRFAQCVVPTLVIVMLIPVLVYATKPDASPDSTALLSIGQVGPKAIALKVWAEKPKGQQAEAGIPAVIRVNVSEKAYLTVIYLSSNGDAIVLLPSRDMPDSLLQPGTEYTLFGAGSPIKLKEIDKARDAKIAFYVTSVPFEPEPLALPSGEPFLRIPASAVDQMGILAKKLEAIGKAPGFNRKVMALKDGVLKSAALDLMGLPTDVRTGEPVGVTGVQGLKSKILEPSRE